MNPPGAAGPGPLDEDDLAAAVAAAPRWLADEVVAAIRAYEKAGGRFLSPVGGVRYALTLLAVSAAGGTGPGR